MSKKSRYPELIKAVQEALKNAYAPYSHFKVGAALLTESGRIFTGCNVENASYGLSNCAERVAIAKAVSDGERTFAAIAVASSSGETTSPCGACRQVIFEFGDKIDIVMPSQTKITIKKIGELLPLGFSLRTGKRT